MADYSKTTDFASKDGLVTGNPLKTVQGVEIGAEFDAIETAVASKADAASPTLSGTVDFTGTATVDTIDEHTADAGVTVDGVLLKDGSLEASVVTEHEAALTITESQISDLGTYLESGDLSSYVETSDVDDTPANGATTDPISSNWAYDLLAGTNGFTTLKIGANWTVSQTGGNLNFLYSGSIRFQLQSDGDLLMEGDWSVGASL